MTGNKLLVTQEAGRVYVHLVRGPGEVLLGWVELTPDQAEAVGESLIAKARQSRPDEATPDPAVNFGA